MPVDLLSFTGKTEPSTNMLIWQTTMESNTQWHIVDRSVDGASKWEEVGRVPAVGFSNELQNYQLKDIKPLGKAYYRLRSVDFDGQENVSSIILLERKTEVFAFLNVYPVPTKDNVIIDFETVVDEQVNIAVTDLLGNVLTQYVVNADSGINTETLDLSRLPSGVYFVTIDNGQQRSTQRVIKN